jgi:ABC-type Fe3+/spermidine/putrescine transport system ATPase subunit
MRVELRNLQRQLGLMFIHVTHNQEEALSMADRIVVMNEARIQQIADPLTIATKPATELVARFMGDNNIIRGKVVERDGARLVAETDQNVRVSVRAPNDSRAIGEPAIVAVRAAAVEVNQNGGPPGLNSAECEIVFVEFLGDLVKLHLLAPGGERMLAKVPGEQYPVLRGREGDTIRISWAEDDVQLLDT